MSVIVSKFGGSSLANIDRIKHVAKIIAATAQTGVKQVIVVSAMYGETDRLLNFASEFAKFDNKREYAVLLSSGEVIAMSLLVMALREQGIRAQSFNATQAGITTNTNYLSAKINQIQDNNIIDALDNGIVTVVAGFQGVDNSGNITTLGRGGSDTTAVALAIQLQATACKIYTDVDGVFTADPKVVPTATKLPVIDYQTMLMLSSYGAKVMQARSISLAAKYQCTIQVLSSFNTTGGTYIMQTEYLEATKVTAIVSKKDMSMVNLLLPNNCEQQFFALLEEQQVEMEMFNLRYLEQQISISFICTTDLLAIITSIIQLLPVELLPDTIFYEKNRAMLSIIGCGINNDTYANMSKIVLQELSLAEVNVYGINAGDLRLTLIVDMQQVDLATQRIHQLFLPACQDVELVIK